ncbi:MAG: hypothetical protein L3J17_13640 [Candidatus Jettenia sp.]|nr:MAG: hypothetical protein L3J17_13640 [Candidatus Jettenia sp.]
MAERITSIKELDFKPQEKAFPSPGDWRDLFIYFLLVDRFDDNKENIPAYDPASAPVGRDPKQGGVFQGGNIKGIIRRLDYIRGLGANAIWLSPVLKNRQERMDSYHGYGIQDFLEVDPRFGTKQDLQELVRQAHKKDMYVILDIIINHTGDNWAYPMIILITIGKKHQVHLTLASGGKSILHRVSREVMPCGHRSFNTRDIIKEEDRSGIGMILMKPYMETL